MISLSVYKYIILFGGIFLWVMSFGQIVKKNRHEGNYIFAALLFCLGHSMIFHGIYHLSEPGTLLSIIKRSNMTAYLCVGPLAYLYFLTVIVPDFRIKKIHAVHFILPAAFILLLWIDFFISDISYPDIHSQVSYAIEKISIIYVIVYLFLVMFIISRLTSEININNIKPALFYTIVFILTGTAWCFANISGLNINDEINALTSVLYVSLFVVGSRYPEYIYNFRNELKTANYKRTYLAGINVKKILEKLKILMEDEKAFCDEDITLTSLARELNISQHQLSEILNLKLKKNFNTFINEYRIKEAQKYLLQDSKRSVLSIATAVGFETSSAFYSAFKKFTGLSPSQFRKKQETQSAFSTASP